MLLIKLRALSSLAIQAQVIVAKVRDLAVSTMESNILVTRTN